MRDFREDYFTQSNIGLRVIDALGHIIVALAIVRVFKYRWWFCAVQWMPDVMLPLIWPFSIITRRYLWEENPLLIFHKALHSWSSLLSCILLFSLVTLMRMHLFSYALAVNLAYPAVFVMINWGWHIFIDSFTHARQK